MNIRVPYEDMKTNLYDILVSKKVHKSDAELIARVLTDNTCDGVASHGINRFDRMLDYLDHAYIDKEAKPEIMNSFGAMEVIDGHLGFGIVNAVYAMDRAIALAQEFGIACVALRNNNHWMRGASYGLMAAEAGLVGICFTNTLPNMPAWGAKEARIGNNPLVIAVPYKDKPVVLDMAMSQFSYGKIEKTSMEGQILPMDGGYNLEGEVTRQPQEILESGRILPMGFWKGSGLSMVLDLMATVLSGGLSTKEISKKPAEFGVSQIFITLDPARLNQEEDISRWTEETIRYIKGSTPASPEEHIAYPGEGSASRRADNLRKGILVNQDVWNKILAYQA